MNVTLEGTRVMYVDGASNSEVLPAKWRNFEGVKRINPRTGKIVNDAGVRNFNLALADDVAQALADMGATVGVLEPRTEDEEVLKFVKVNVKVDAKYPPKLHFSNHEYEAKLIPINQYPILDRAIFDNVDLVINLYHSEEGKTTLYLDQGYFTLKEDPISAKYKKYTPEIVGESLDDIGSIYGETDEVPFK